MADEDNNMLPTVFEFSEDVAEQTQPDPLPDGTYRGSVSSVERKLSKAGNDYADISLKIDPAQYPVDWTQANEYPDGIVLHYRRVQIEDSPRGRFRLRRFVETVNFPKVNRKLDLVEWIGRDVKIEVKAELGQDGLKYAQPVSLSAV